MIPSQETSQTSLAGLHHYGLAQSLRIRTQPHTKENDNGDSRAAYQHSPPSRAAVATIADGSSNARSQNESVVMEGSACSIADKSSRKRHARAHAPPARAAAGHADMWPWLMVSLPIKSAANATSEAALPVVKVCSGSRSKVRHMRRAEATRRCLHRLERGFCSADWDSAAPLHR